MPNEIEISRLQDLKRELVVLENENADRVSSDEAVMAALKLVRSYPTSTPSDPEIYLDQVSILLGEYSRTAIHTMLDPRRGILRTCVFLPTLAEIVQWLHDYAADEQDQMRSLRRSIGDLEAPLPPPDPEYDPRPPIEVRLKQIEDIPPSLRKPEKIRLKDLEWLKPLEQQSAKEREMNERFAKTQRSVPEEAMAGLKNLDNMVPGSKG